MGASGYGNYYWGVKTPVSESGEIYLHADRVEVQQDGTLVFWREDKFQNLILAPGQWTAVFAAAIMDGHAVAVEHWS